MSTDANTDQREGVDISRRPIRRNVPPFMYAFLLLVVLLVLFTAGNKNFVSAYNLNNIASYSVVLVIVALGQTAAILTGGIDLSVGGLMSFVSVVFMSLFKTVGPWAYPVCIGIGAIVGYTNGTILTRIRIPSLIATLGTGGILTSLSLLVSPLPFDIPADSYGRLNLVNGSLLGISNALVLGVVLFIISYLLLRHTVIGKSIYYVGSNIKMSWMSGIDTTRTRNTAFTISGLGAATAAIVLSCQQYGGDPTLGTVYVLTSIAAVVIGGTALTGGTGGAVNTLIGALTLGVLENGMNIVGIDAFFQQSILGLMVIVSVMLTFDRTKTPVVK